MAASALDWLCVSLAQNYKHGNRQNYDHDAKIIVAVFSQSRPNKTPV
jgi:hypothetical protein